MRSSMPNRFLVTVDKEKYRARLLMIIGSLSGILRNGVTYALHLTIRTLQ